MQLKGKKRLLAKLMLSVLLVMQCAVGSVQEVEASGFTIRNSPPATSNKYYYDSAYNANAGSGNYKMPNCTTYVLGRVYEITGKRFNISGNAGEYYGNNSSYACSTNAYEPALGAVVCYSTSTYGHVQVVEEIGEDSGGRYICISESNLGGRSTPSQSFNYLKIYLSNLASSASTGRCYVTWLEDNDGYSSSQEQNWSYIYANFQGYIYPDGVESSTITSEFPLVNNSVYQIRNVNSNKLITIPAASSENSTELLQWETANVQWQHWRAIKHSDGYSFVSVHNGKAMDIRNGTAYIGENLQLYDYCAVDAQRFKVVYRGDGKYSIHPVCSNLAVGIHDASTENNGYIKQNKYTGESNQLWMFEVIDVEVGNSEFPLKDNGVYQICNVNSGKVIGIPSASNANSIELHQWEAANVDWQKWKAVRHADGYSFVSVYNNKAISLRYGSSNVGGCIQSYDYCVADAQRFKIIDRGDGKYSIHPVCSDLAVDVFGASTENNGWIKQYEYSGESSQLWMFEVMDAEVGNSEFPLKDNGVYQIRNVNSGKVIGIPNASNANSIELHQWEASNVDWQKWKAVRHADGYSFVSVYNDKAISLRYGSSNVGGCIQSYDYCAADAQRFKIIDRGDGKYSIHPVCSDLAVDVLGASTENNGWIRQYEYDGEQSQLWIFEIVGNEASTPSALPFTDVPQGSWYYDYVANVYEKGYMVGSGTTFKPAGLLTRAEIVTTLYSMNGRPATEAVNNFADVASGQWYSTPVSWAYRNNIASGYANGKFGTTDLITREQFAVMLYQYASSYGFKTTYSDSALNGYTDAGAISSWANTAMKWAVSNEIISGKTATTLDPRGNATRAECATMITKLDQLKNK